MKNEKKFNQNTPATAATVTVERDVFNKCTVHWPMQTLKYENNNNNAHAHTHTHTMRVSPSYDKQHSHTDKVSDTNTDRYMAGVAHLSHHIRARIFVLLSLSPSLSSQHPTSGMGSSHDARFSPSLCVFVLVYSFVARMFLFFLCFSFVTIYIYNFLRSIRRVCVCVDVVESTLNGSQSLTRPSRNKKRSEQDSGVHLNRMKTKKKKKWRQMIVP